MTHGLRLDTAVLSLFISAVASTGFADDDHFATNVIAEEHYYRAEVGNLSVNGCIQDYYWASYEHVRASGATSLPPNLRPTVFVSFNRYDVCTGEGMHEEGWVELQPGTYPQNPSTDRFRIRTAVPSCVYLSNHGDDGTCDNNNVIYVDLTFSGTGLSAEQTDSWNDGTNTTVQQERWYGANVSGILSGVTFRKTFWRSKIGGFNEIDYYLLAGIVESPERIFQREEDCERD